MQSVYAAINARIASNHTHCRDVVAAFGPQHFSHPDGSPVLASEALHGKECPVEETLQALAASGNALLKHVKDHEAKLTLTSARPRSRAKPVARPPVELRTARAWAPLGRSTDRFSDLCFRSLSVSQSR